MELNSLAILGNSSIGIFGLATDNVAIIPYSINQDTYDTIEETLQVPIIKTTINNSNLNGLFGVGNSNHILLPSLVTEYELDNIKENLPDDITVDVLNSTITALGNVIVTTDDLAIISPEFNQSERQSIEDTLDVEIVSRSLLGTSIVGSLIFSTNNGMLTHPLIEDEDLDWLEKNFDIPADVVTVNRGTPYPRPGLMGNKNGVLVGSDTTGPELMRIFEVLS